MNNIKPKVDYFIDVLMILSLVITTITSIILLLFPSGQKSGYNEFLGIIKRDWVIIHKIVGIIFLILMIIHLILHWKWIICMTKNIFNKNKLCQKEN